MLYYTWLQGVFIDVAGDPPQASVDTGSGRANFAHILERSVAFDSLDGLDPQAGELGRGAPVALTGDSGAEPVAGAVYAGSGTLHTAPFFVGYPDEVEVAIHPVPGHFLVAGSLTDPGQQQVYFVTGFPLDSLSVGYDLSFPPELALSDVKIADLATTPPLDQEKWAGLRAELLRFGARGTAVGYDPDGVFVPSGAGGPPCFTFGTWIETACGPRPVESLAPGVLLCTGEHGMQPLRWIGRVALSAGRLAENPGLRPIRIRAGALGAGRPATDLLVSPQHRVLVRSPVARRMFGAEEVLVAARQLLGLPGIAVAGELRQVAYCHLLLDRHELLWSNGALTESLYPGPEALRAVGAAARREILTLFPALRAAPPQPARPMVPGRKGRKLAARHRMSRRPLLA